MSGLVVESGRSLKEFTSWLVGGEAEHYCAPETIDQLKEAMVIAKKNSWEVSVLGGGSNALVSDSGVPGLVIHTNKLQKIISDLTDEHLIIEAETGVLKSEALKIFLKNRLQPAVFLAGLPGDMGGGVVMNAGVGHSVSPREFCEIVDSVEVLRLNDSGEVEEKRYDHSQIQWSYRRSDGWQPGIISRVWLRWPNEPNDAVLKEVRDGNQRRKSTQPLNMPSCGSVFKNPTGDHAGRLIEEAGLKGFQIGGAQVSEKHANFIVNTGNSTAMDIHNVIDHVQDVVATKFGIELTNEVVYFGSWF